MSHIISAFFLSTLAGLSTLLGAIVIFCKNRNETIIYKSLAFAVGVMITISLSSLFPESHILLAQKFSSIYIVFLSILFFILGFLIFVIINLIIPDINHNQMDSKLYRVGVISMCAIILHNVPEGIATFMTSTHDFSLGFSLALAIALHNIPEGISISVPIYFSTNNRKKALFYTFISGISELFGAVFAYLFLQNIMTDVGMGVLYCIIAGIMISISFFELLPKALETNKIISTVFYILLGSLVMLLSQIAFV